MRWLLALGLLVSLCASADETHVLDYITRPMDTISQGGWRFAGCFTKDSHYESCRHVFRNGHYCKSEWLGRRYECLAFEKTKPYACYCWE